MTLLEAGQHTLVFQKLHDMHAAKLAKSAQSVKTRWAAGVAVETITYLAEHARQYNGANPDDVITVDDLIEALAQAIALLHQHR